MKHSNVRKFGERQFKLKIGKMPIGWPQFSVDYSTQLIDSGCDIDVIDNLQ